MKLLFMPALLLLTMVVSCSSGLDPSENTQLECHAPDWYPERDTATTVDYGEHISYGEGRTEAEAWDDAALWIVIRWEMERDESKRTLCGRFTNEQCPPIYIGSKNTVSGIKIAFQTGHSGIVVGVG